MSITKFFQTVLFLAVFTTVIFLISFAGADFFLKKNRLSPASSIKQVNELKKINSEQKPVFNPAFLDWQQAASSAAWPKRDAHAVFVFQNKLWLMGGLTGKVNGQTKDYKNIVNYWEDTHYNDIWFSENGIDWQLAVKNAEWKPRRSLSVVFFNNKLWLMAGWSPINGYQSDIWTSDDAIHWTKEVDKAPWPAREGQTVNVFNNQLWLMGGVDFDKRKPMNDIWVSEDGLNWIEATTSASWSPRYDQAVEVFQNKMWLSGGLNTEGQGNGEVWYSENGKDWQLSTEFAPWEPRHGHSLLVYKNKLWIISGWNTEKDKGINDAWYSDNGINWYKTLNDGAWLGREDHASLIFQDKIWFLGGMNANWQWTNDIWQSKLITADDLTAAAFLSAQIDRNGKIKILVEKEKNKRLPLASITKLITALTAVKNYPVSKEITITQEAVDEKEDFGQLKAGDVFIVEELLKVLLVESSNDAAKALALEIDEKKFIDLMNQTIQEIGLKNTRFNNATGLDPINNEEINYSTAEDMLNLSVFLIKNYPSIFSMTALNNYKLYTAKGFLHHVLKNTNKLFNDKSWPFTIVGSKTGETAKAGKNLLLITQSSNQKDYLISVILGSQDNFEDAKKMVGWADQFIQ